MNQTRKPVCGSLQENTVMGRTNRAVMRMAVVLLSTYSFHAAALETTAGDGQPRYGTYGFDSAGMDPQVRPGDNFYHYLNGQWQQTVRSASDRPVNSMFIYVADRAQRDTRAIIESVAKAGNTQSVDAQKVADAYRSFMNAALIEKRGLVPLENVFSAIGKINSRDALVIQMAALKRDEGLATPLGMSIGQDDKRPDRHWVTLWQDGLGLDDRDMYEPKNKQFEKQRAGYKAYLQQLFILAGFNKPAQRAQAVYALEEKLAQAHWPRVENRDPQKTYNARRLQDWQMQAPGVNWQTWFEGLGLGAQTEFGVGQPDALIKTAALINSEPLDAWKNYLYAHVLDDAAIYLPQRFADARFQFRGTIMFGTPYSQERWKRAVRFTEQALPDALSKLYVAKHFPPATKARADALVQNLLKAMGGRIKQLNWMSDATKARALQKLAAYRPKIGYPRKWKDYAALQIQPDDLMGNVRRAHAYHYNYALAKLGKPVDRDEWYVTPMTVNAYYNPVLNEIVFPAAILQPPFFDPQADDAVNYGAIGSIIGHEITHGFDDTGRQYDAKGALNDWWTEQDAQRFNASAEKLVAQYSAYCPFKGLCVNGKLTLGENIADIGGLAVAYDAYQLSLKGKRAPVINNRSGDQRFFEGYGQIWRSVIWDNAAKNLLTRDTHAPDQYRVQTVRNFAPWYQAYKITPDQKLFLLPEQRVMIW
jgi:putative endopeptidase